MLWINKEDSRLVKAWEAVTPKSSAVSSVAFAQNADYFVAAKAGKLPSFFTKIIPHVMVADSVIDWIEYEGWQDLSFDDVAEKVKIELENYPAKTLERIREMEIVFVQSRVEGLAEIKRKRTAPFNRINAPEYV